MSAPERRITTLAKLAWACAALVLAITTLSAFIRLSQAGIGCEPWPQCFARSAHADADAQESSAPAVTAARIAHRVVAVIALLLVIWMVMTTLASGPMLWREGRLALTLLGLALFLAILGRWTAGAKVPAVMLGNLLGGFAMFAVSCLLALTVTRGSAPNAGGRLKFWARIGVAVLTGQIVLGGLVSAGQAGLRCPQLTACDMGSGSWQLLNPWRETRLDPTGNPANPAGALVHGLHRAGALVVAAVLLPLAVGAWRSGRRSFAASMAGLLALQAALGALQVLAGLPLAIALAHNVVAALLLAAVLAFAADGRR